MGLRGQLNDVGSDSIPLYLVALIASSISHIRSILLTFFLRPVSAQSSSSSSTQHHDSDDITRSTDDLSIFNIGSRLTGLILLSEQLCLNRNLSYSHYSSATDITTRISSDPESDDDDDDDCVVCLSKLIDGDRVRKLPCLHVFHTDCLESWIQLMNFNCPLCRRSVVSVERDDEYERRVADHQSLVATDAESWFAAVQV